MRQEIDGLKVGVIRLENSNQSLRIDNAAYAEEQSCFEDFLIDHNLSFGYSCFKLGRKAELARNALDRLKGYTAPAMNPSVIANFVDSVTESVMGLVKGKVRE